MNRTEAERLVEELLDEFRTEPYSALAARVGGESILRETDGASGAHYQLEILFLWDDYEGGSVRVMGSIDDGGLTAFMPLTRSFIKASDGSFVGE
jgi:hypothetical protein